MMKRFLCLFLATLFLSIPLISCGEQKPEDPASSSALPDSSAEPADSGTEPQTEPSTEAPATEEPATSKYEYEYVAPEDGSFTICGVPLSEYTLVLSWPGIDAYALMDYHVYKDKLSDITSSATGFDLEVKVTRNDKIFNEKKYDHEILFGNGFVRDGMPERDLNKNYYGVTADGTVYFSSPALTVYPYLWQLFLEEFFGVPMKSGERSAGCAVPECYRELPAMDAAQVESLGYAMVFEDEFDADELDLNTWFHRGLGPEGNGFNAASAVSLSNGFLVIRGDYRDGEYGEGWYGGQIALNQTYCRGYFEARIRCSMCLGRNKDMWSAFWIQGPNPYIPEYSQGGAGPGGAEIDIMETFGVDEFTCCIHCGWEDGLVSDLSVVPNLGNRYDEEFHTFALLWDEDFYRIYLDGVLMHCTDHKAGTSNVEEFVDFELVVGSVPADRSETREMVVDYLRIWQK